MTGKKPGKIEQNVNIPWVYLDKGKAGGYIISKVITDYLKENETPINIWRKRIMVFEAIAELVAERVEKDVSEITMDSKFQDLGSDSLRHVTADEPGGQAGHRGGAGPESGDRG